jgi:hypothetical protein
MLSALIASAETDGERGVTVSKLSTVPFQHPNHSFGILGSGPATAVDSGTYFGPGSAVIEHAAASTTAAAAKVVAHSCFMGPAQHSLSTTCTIPANRIYSLFRIVFTHKIVATLDVSNGYNASIGHMIEVERELVFAIVT